MNNLKPYEKRMILKAIQQGILNEDEVRQSNFDFRIYTLTELPLFVHKSSKEGFVNFMGTDITLDLFNQLKAYYKELGMNQEMYV